MRFLITLIVFLHLSIFLSAQLYHFETGKIIPGDEPGLFSTRKGVFNSYPAEYSVLLVHENRRKHNSRLISLPIIRIKSVDPDSSSYPIFLLHGGPGESNLKKDFLNDDLLRYHDLVLIGYRGADGQIKLDCPNVKQALLSDQLSIETSERLFRNGLEQCVQILIEQGVDVNAYTIADVVSDIYEAKKAYGYDKISFLAFSFGTILAQQYAFIHPNETKNLCLIGARPLNNLKMDGNALEKQVQKFIHYYSDKHIQDSFIQFEQLNERIYKLSQIHSSITLPGLFIYGFSQLYTINEVETFWEKVLDASYNDTLAILNSYTQFFKKYPGDVLLGDMYLKKKGQITFDSEHENKNSFGQKLVAELNNWYSPTCPFLSQTQSFLIDTISQKTLFISGELDVASPPELLKPILPYFVNSKLLELPKTGHLDFFFEQKRVVDSLIFEFYLEN